MRLRLAGRQVLAVHLIYAGLSFVVFAPVLGVLGRLLLKLSGKSVLADMDLLLFALTPGGLIAFGLFATATLVVFTFELASLLAIGVAGANGQSISVIAALDFSLKRLKPIFLLAAWWLFKLLIIVTPFLLAASAVAFFLITDHDINYYLTARPMEFWIAVFVIGVIVFLMVVIVIRKLISWSLTLPLVLFVGTPPSKSFAASTSLTNKSGGTILRMFVTWAALVFLLGAVVTVAVQMLADLIVPIAMGSIAMLALTFGFLAGLWLTAGTLATSLATGSLAFLLAVLAHRLEPELRVVGLKPNPGGVFIAAKMTRRSYAWGLTAAVGIAAFFGVAVLDDIRLADDSKIIAHRGAAGAAPENTLAAIRRAVADEADWVEVDVQETADGEVVVIHDSDLMKLAGVDLRVWEASMEQLAEIDIGSWFAPEFAEERVPTLADVLAEVNGKSKLIIELKYYGHDQQLEQRVVDLVEAADMQDDTMIMSLQYGGIQKVRALRPNWKTGLLTARAIGDLTRVDADFLAVNMGMASQALIKAAHGAGKELYVWTVNDILGMSQMMSLGVDGIITDEPMLGRDVLVTRAELSTVQRLILHIAPLLGVRAPSLDIDSNDADSG